MNIFDTIKYIYQKNKTITEFDDGISIVINKWLSWDKDNIPHLKRIMKYLFYIEPIHYYYLLYFNIPKKRFVPFLKNKDTKTEEETELIKKIQYVFGWSKKELSKNKRILAQTILKNQEYWKGELGL